MFLSLYRAGFIKKTNSSELNFRYETIEVGDLDIHLRSLRSVQEYYDENNEALEFGITDAQWSLSGVLWPSGYILASIMEKKVIKNIKILEVGCGLALSSLVVRLRGGNITATDCNPAVKSFLKENSRINKCDEISFIRADWNNLNLDSEVKYDLIIGSDILYQRDHSLELAQFINENAEKKCEVILVDPKRGNKNNFSREMQRNYFVHEQDNQVFLDQFKQTYNGSVSYYYRNN